VTASVFCAGFVSGETLPTVLSARCAVPRLTSARAANSSMLSPGFSLSTARALSMGLCIKFAFCKSGTPCRARTFATVWG